MAAGGSSPEKNTYYSERGSQYAGVSLSLHESLTVDAILRDTDLPKPLHGRLVAARVVFPCYGRAVTRRWFASVYAPVVGPDASVSRVIL